MRREANEIRFRIKLFFGLFMLGAFFGVGYFVWSAAEATGGSVGWTLVRWFKYAVSLQKHGFGMEMLAHAGLGACGLSAPLLAYMFFPAKPGPGGYNPL